MGWIFIQQVSGFGDQDVEMKLFILEEASFFSSIEASSPSFISKAHLGEAPSFMAYSLMDGASSHLFSFVFCCISMVDNHH